MYIYSCFMIWKQVLGNRYDLSIVCMSFTVIVPTYNMYVGESRQLNKSQFQAFKNIYRIGQSI